MWSGSMTALVTPFRHGEIDFGRLAEQVAFQIDRGIGGLVPCGTTGESPTLSDEEHEAIVRFVVREASGRVPVLAGTGTNDTRKALSLTKTSARSGASGALIVVPYYNKPSQEGLYEHYRRIHDAVDLPLMLYDVPSRTGTALAVDTIARLSELPRVVAIKDASGDIDKASRILGRCDVTLFSGNDSMTLPLLAVGARGVVSVAANLLPGETTELVRLFDSGRIEEARALHHRLFPLFEALFLEPNPVPVKAAMELRSRDSGELRLPLHPACNETRRRLGETLRPFL